MLHFLSRRNGRPSQRRVYNKSGAKLLNSAMIFASMRLRRAKGFMKRTTSWSVFVTCFVVLGLIDLLAVSAKCAEAYTEVPGTEGDGDYQVGPDYKIDPDLTDQGNPKGKYFELSMPLADSKVFRGDDPTLQPQKKPVR